MRDKVECLFAIDEAQAADALKLELVPRLPNWVQLSTYWTLATVLHVWKQQASWKSLSQGHLGEQCESDTSTIDSKMINMALPPATK